jgi:CHAT domain-containing protein/tetratricopeptide (TPR) repeat protein
MLTLRHIHFCWLVALFPSLLLTGCGSSTATRPVLAATCMQIGGARESTLNVKAPDDGTLRFQIQERGISVVATLDGDTATAGETPVERLGTIDLVAPVKRGDSHLVSVKANDSPDITAEVCVRADLIAVSDEVRTSAATAFANAGRATRTFDWNKAFDQYLTAARRFDQLGERHSSGAARQAMAEIAYRRFDNKRDVYALASQALADYGEGAESFIRGALIGLQSKALFEMPDLEISAIAPEIRRLLASARKALRTSPIGSRELPRLKIMEGFLEYRLEAPGPARAAFIEAAHSCQQMRDWGCYARANQNLAALAYESKNYTAAMFAFGDALRQLPPELDPKLAAEIWANYGAMQGKVGLFGSSQRSYATAMRVYGQLGDCQGVRRSLQHSGILMVQLGSLSDAKNDLQQAVSLDCTELLASAGRPSTRNTTAPWCTRLLNPEELTTEDKTILLYSLVSLGRALQLEGDSARAMQCLDAAIPYAGVGRLQVPLAIARGEVLLDNDKPTDARSSFERALHIADEAQGPHEYRGYAQLGIAKSALLAGDSNRAVQDALSATEAGVKRGDIEQTVTALKVLAEGYRGLKQPEQAAKTLQTAVSLIETVPTDELDGEKRATYLATQHSVFSELTDLYASDDQTTAPAFLTSERGRARSLRYAASQTQGDTPVDPTTLPTARYQQMLQHVVELTASKTNLLDALAQEATHEGHADDPFDQQRLTRTLGQLKATLVEYSAGPRDMFAFIANDSGLRVVRLGDRQKISAAAADLHDRLLDPESPRSDIRASARQLAELVLWPLTAQLGARRLIFVPDEGLHTIPFNILPWSATASDQLVLQHAEVAIVPSARFLTRMQANMPARDSAPRVELLGDPVFRIADWHHECADPLSGQKTARTTRAASDWTESLPRLPGSRAEVQMVARLTQQTRPSSHVETLLGCAAVPSALRRAASGRVDLLHIATHARVDSQRPRLSSLALTPENSDDPRSGAFGLLDILGLKLSANLVVLSACETSRGRLLPGEGVLGPAQAFLQAGAGAVIASYWRVDDQATSAFMQRFYKYLLSERLPAATALRRAQLDEAEASSSYDWAAFSLYGWPDSSI